MALPLNVIEQLARTLRNRETTIALQGLNAYSRVARQALLRIGGFSAIDALEIRTSQLEKVVPLPFAQHVFADNSAYIEFDGHRLTPNENLRAPDIDWLIVARSEEGDRIVASSDPHVFEPGDISAAIDLSAYERNTPVKYNNLILAANVAIYIVDSWKDAAVILNGLFNPVENPEFCIDVTIEAPAELGDAPKVDSSLTMQGSDIRPNGAQILGAKVDTATDVLNKIAEQFDIGTLVPGSTDELTTQVVEALNDIITKAENRDGPIVTLYAKDFDTILSSIEGPANPAKLRTAFKAHFAKKWNLSK
jgi:hypothetical protein